MTPEIIYTACPPALPALHGHLSVVSPVWYPISFLLVLGLQLHVRVLRCIHLPELLGRVAATRPQRRFCHHGPHLETEA